MWENTTPSTELPRDFCAGIGPLHLGVVLVSYLLYIIQIDQVDLIEWIDQHYLSGCILDNYDMMPRCDSQNL